MKLRQIKITNFRKFDNAVIPITDSHLILGANDTGKTTILLAINKALSGDPVEKGDLKRSNQYAEITLNFYDEQNQIMKTLIYKSKGTKASTKLDTLPEGIEQEFINKHLFIPSRLIKAEDIALNIALNRRPEIADQISEVESLLNQEVQNMLNQEDHNELLKIDNPSEFTCVSQLKPTANIKTHAESLDLSQRGDGYKKIFQ